MKSLSLKTLALVLVSSSAFAGTAELFKCDMTDLQTGQNLLGSAYSVSIANEKANLLTTPVVPGGLPSVVTSLLPTKSRTELVTIFSAGKSKSPVEFVRNGTVGLLTISSVGRLSTFACSSK